MKNIFITFLASLSIFFINAHAANAAQHKITLKQARALVWATLSPEVLRLPGIEILDANKDPENIASYEGTDPRYLNFSVMSNASDGVSYYTVDSYTGDVFDPTGDCAEHIDKRLMAFQKKVRRSLHLTDTQYRKIKTKGPNCTE